jgi:hypothetical protein
MIDKASIQTAQYERGTTGGSMRGATSGAGATRGAMTGFARDCLFLSLAFLLDSKMPSSIFSAEVIFGRKSRTSVRSVCI